LRRRKQEENKIKRMQLLAQQQADKQLSRLLDKPLTLTIINLDVNCSTSITAAMNAEQHESEVLVKFFHLMHLIVHVVFCAEIHCRQLQSSV
jgi:hypothetical protein